VLVGATTFAGWRAATKPSSSPSASLG
jgi:hypothetical protein